jgi:hypothetical protein
MAIVQISRIQQRRGLQQDLPNLASAELAWSVDSRRLYIGNGTIEEGAPTLGRTEVLTEYSILNFTTSFGANISALTANVAILQGGVIAIQNSLAYSTYTANASSSGTISTITSNNTAISYSLEQGNTKRLGTINLSQYSGTNINYNEEYEETAPSDLTFTFTGNGTTVNWGYTTTSATTVKYQVKPI